MSKEKEKIDTAEKFFQSEIDRLEEEKKKYISDDDCYSWHIANDEQEIWIKALSILRTGQLPKDENKIDDDTLPY